MNLGGPVWHVSISPQQLPLGPATLERIARRELVNVGDAARGEWTEWTGRAFHLRRRLSESEDALVGPVLDVRGTPDAARRARALGDRLRLVPADIVADEVGTPA